MLSVLSRSGTIFADEEFRLLVKNVAVPNRENPSDDFDLQPLLSRYRVLKAGSVLKTEPSLNVSAFVRGLTIGQLD